MLASLKSAAFSMLRATCASGLLDGRQDAVLTRWLPRLLDEKAVPREYIPARLREQRVEVLCNPYTFTHRAPLLFGRLFERSVEVLMQRALRPGDTFIDIGANCGHMTMLAATLVGCDHQSGNGKPAGRVVAFEPHPALAQLVQNHARQQHFSRVTVHACALGSQDDTLTLTADPKHLGGAAIAQLRGAPVAHASQSFQVPVRNADYMLRDVSAPAFVKLDVEGAEPFVIAGMPKTLAGPVQAAMVEISPDWIGGPAAVATMFAAFARAGLPAFDFERLGEDDAAQSTDVLRALRPEDVTSQRNVLFVREKFARARGLMA
jgi:FkbM family methyltransferase